MLDNLEGRLDDRPSSPVRLPTEPVIFFQPGVGAIFSKNARIITSEQIRAGLAPRPSLPAAMVKLALRDVGWVGWQIVRQVLMLPLVPLTTVIWLRGDENSTWREARQETPKALLWILGLPFAGFRAYYLSLKARASKQLDCADTVKQNPN